MFAPLRSPRKSGLSAFHRLMAVTGRSIFFSPRFWCRLIALPVRRVMNSLRYHPYLLKCHEAMRLVDLTATTDDALGPSER